MKLNHRALAACALALAVSVTACSSDTADEASTPTSAAPAQEEPGDATAQPTSAPADGAQEESQEESQDAQGESAGPAPADESQDAAESEEAEAPQQTGSNTLEVTVEGDQGVLALQHSGSVPEGTAGPTGRQLITGPGGCFALTHEGPPQFVVFPADATFVLQQGKPSATVEGTEHLVGREFTLETTVVNTSEVTGIPDRCARGSADTVLVVN